MTSQRVLAATSVCRQDLGGALTQIGVLMRRTIGSPCLEGVLADADPATPGLIDFDCVVEDVVGTTVTKIEECDASARPTCWKLQVDLSCLGPMNLKLVVTRDAAPPPETVTRMRCKVEP